ncbi:MAG: SDR family NAD(P)-dependent oxidoreductase [Flavobacteriia bacterium]|jgi:decaprenylphospho-beta-D-erythro-pentofuranosid-2-ulose 2-reductase
MKTLLILGSNSDVAIACETKFSKEGFNVILASRTNEKHLSNWIYFDALDTENHYEFYKKINPKPDLVLSTFGYLGSQNLAFDNFNESSLILQTNLIGNISILNVVAKEMAKQKQGSIICISSVAGERGRKSNYIYGAAKAGLTAYLSGLRAKMLESNVFVSTIVPGFIKTKMLGNLKTPNILTASPEQVAESIWSAYKNKKNKVYVLPIWRLIMFIIKLIPEGVFKKMNL